jgi:hypothetical protein
MERTLDNISESACSSMKTIIVHVILLLEEWEWMKWIESIQREFQNKLVQLIHVVWNSPNHWYDGNNCFIVRDNDLTQKNEMK